MNSYNEHTDYKLTDLDYLTGDHHLQMMKAALPFLNAVSYTHLSFDAPLGIQCSTSAKLIRG